MPESRPLHAGDPTSLAGYRLEGRLGQGGQGIVYLGTDQDGKQAAIKVLNADLAADTGFQRRFRREAEAARRVASFCTAQVLDASFEVEQPYIISEYIDGPSLKDDLASNGPRSGAELHRLAVATATALVAVHEAGIVHRDFKPANVLMAAEGPRVIDFGVADVVDVTGAQTQSVIGTPGYMAPEQIRGETTAPAADVFSWGAVMTFAATGNAPFGGNSIPAVMNQVLSAEADLSELDEPWRSIIARCLAKATADRPTSAELLMMLLRRDATDPVAATPAIAQGAAVGGAPPAGGGAASGSDSTGGSSGAGGSTPVDIAPRAASENGGGRSRGRLLAVIGAVAALLLVVGAGGFVIWGPLKIGSSAASGTAPVSVPSAASPPGEASPTPETSASAEESAQPDSSAQTEVQSSGEPSPEPEKPSENPDEDPAVTFPPKLAGDWVAFGTFPDQTQREYHLNIEAGSGTASITTSDDTCTWSLDLFRPNDAGGVDGRLGSGAGCGPQKNAGLWLDNGRLAVLFWGGKDGAFPEHFFHMDRP